MCDELLKYVSARQIPPRFEPGVMCTTHGARIALLRANVESWSLMKRHLTGDWGELSAEDAAANDQAIKDGSRILSNYGLPTGERIWIITEADRSVTTVLFPSEY